MNEISPPPKSKFSRRLPRSLGIIVQRNCHISDARFAGDYSLCIYLLKMREYYRWEKGLPLGASLSNEAVGRWVQQRERQWEQVESDPYEQLHMVGQRFDPFDNDGINRELLPRGLVYSGGYGRFCKPHFFLGRLLRTERCRGYTVLISANEYARDLTAPPAMTLGRTIFLRRESLRRVVWEKIEEWRWKRQNQAMTRALAGLDVEHELERVLERVTDRELTWIIRHEIGEIMAGEQLGDAWHDMLLTVARTPAEIFARAVRDQLADFLSTLPVLLECADTASIDFYFAGLHGMRKELCPTLVRAYQDWVDTGDLDELNSMLPAGKRHWLSVAHSALDLHRQHGDECAHYIEGLMKDSRM
ncbi:MAG: Sfum_1244 family protein [Acidiferrobacterales bacterium]